MNHGRVFITSDGHFGHERIISMCDRPFADVGEMNEALVARWNSVVRKDDIVYHLGDFCLGNKDQVRGWLKRLNGRVRLVIGNHDTYKFQDYYSMGFDRVYDYPICYQEWYWLSHRPIFLPVNSPHVVIHGHTHQNSYGDDMHYYNACVEQTNYAPVLFDEIVQIFKKRLGKLGKK